MKTHTQTCCVNKKYFLRLHGGPPVSKSMLVENLPEDVVVTVVPEADGFSMQKWEEEVEGFGSSWAKSLGVFVRMSGSTERSISDSGTAE